MVSDRANNELEPLVESELLGKSMHSEKTCPSASLSTTDPI
jgi:hypothetical protein